MTLSSVPFFCGASFCIPYANDEIVDPIDCRIDVIENGKVGCLLCVELVPASFLRHDRRPFLSLSVGEEPLADPSRRDKVDFRPVHDELQVDEVAGSVARALYRMQLLGNLVV